MKLFILTLEKFSKNEFHSNFITAPSSAPLELIDTNKLIHPSIQRESQCHLLDKQTPKCELFVENENNPVVKNIMQDREKGVGSKNTVESVENMVSDVQCSMQNSRSMRYQTVQCLRIFNKPR